MSIHCSLCMTCIQEFYHENEIYEKKLKRDSKIRKEKTIKIINSSIEIIENLKSRLEKGNSKIDQILKK
jgi:hypothetical protein